MPKIRIKDIGAVCEKLGMKKFRRKFYDAPAIDEWRLLDNVGATLVEIPIWVYDGVAEVLGTKIETQSDLDKVAKKIAIQVSRQIPHMTAKTLSDDKIWKWLSRNGELSKKDAKYYTYTKNTDYILFHCNEYSIPWVPFTNGSESRPIADSDSSPLGKIGMDVKLMAKWLEKNGIRKAKREKRVSRSFSYYD